MEGLYAAKLWRDAMRRAIFSIALSGTRGGSLVKKLLYRRDRPRRVFFLGGVPQILEDH